MGRRVQRVLSTVRGSGWVRLDAQLSYPFATANGTDTDETVANGTEDAIRYAERY